MNNLSNGTYYKDPNLEVLVTEFNTDFREVDMAELTCKRPVVCKELYRATEGANGTSVVKKQAFEAGKAYTFDLTLVDQIFDALYAEKLIRLDNGHKMLKAEDLKGKEFCKWHSSWHHYTNSCVVFRNMIQESIDKGILKFSNKPMGVDTNSFLEVSSSIVTPDLSKLTKPRPKLDVGQTINMHIENKYGKAQARTIHDLMMSHEIE